MSDSVVPFDITDTFIDLRGVNTARPVPAGEDFWWKLAAGDIQPSPDRLLIRSRQTQNWQHWERHPIGEEVIIQISGHTILVLDCNDGIQEVTLRGSQTVIIPRKCWHTMRVQEPADMIFITPGEGTEHRSLET